MSQQINTADINQAVSLDTQSVASAPLLHNAAAMVFGLLVIFAVGFLPMAAAHNAAHDTRHTLAFPCH